VVHKGASEVPNEVYLTVQIANAHFAGRTNEARIAASRLTQLLPDFRVSHAYDVFPFPSGFLEMFAEGLRKSGVPE
jgi:hypothetical protein